MRCSPTPATDSGKAFLDQDCDDVRHVIDTNVTGTIVSGPSVGRDDARARAGPHPASPDRSPASCPGPIQAVYNGTKAFLDSFSFALRAELKDSGVTVTCLMPGATETEFFERADMLDTKVGQSKKDDPADVAKVGFDAMMRGDGDVVSGWQNKLRRRSRASRPSGVLAEKHRSMAEPGSGRRSNGIRDGASRALGDRARRRRARPVGREEAIERAASGRRRAGDHRRSLIWRSARSDTRERLGGSAARSSRSRWQSIGIRRSSTSSGALSTCCRWSSRGCNPWRRSAIGARTGSPRAGGLPVEWDAEIINEMPNKLIALAVDRGLRRRSAPGR